MNAQTTPMDDDMPAEIDFAGAKRGQFYRTGAQLNLPVYLDQKVQDTLASAKGVELSALINAMLKKDIELMQIALQHKRNRSQTQATCPSVIASWGSAGGFFDDLICI